MLNVKLLSKIGHGAQSTVFLAEWAGRTVALKLPAAGAGAEEAMLRFRREAALLARVAHPGLPRALTVGEWQGQPCLVMEYVEGQTLEQVLRRGPLDPGRVADVARILAGALHELHRRGLVHRDVNPRNVVMEPGGGVRLVDLGLLAPSYLPTDEPLAGTLHYAAPEQTGLLRRPVDGRTDLYGLGVLLFEAATGTLPFTADTPAELAHMHVALAAPPATDLNPRLSPALGAIIAKLLAKEPEERYQSGSGLLADLDRLERLDRAIAQGEPLQLGVGDAPEDVRDEVACIGRGPELDRLHTAWRRVLRGEGQLAALEGEPGAGKSRVVREFLRHVPPRARLTAKCTEGDAVPFGPVREALEAHILSWRRMSPADAAQCEAALREAAASTGSAPALHRLSPALAGVLAGVSPQAERPEGTEAFLDSLADLIKRLAELHRGLVLFVDDLQWADESTIAFLLRLARRLAEAPLLLLLALRDEAVGTSTLDRVAEGLQGLAAYRIPLKPLPPEAVARLVSAHLGGAGADPAFLHQVVLHTGGNPFAVSEYLQTVLEAGVLWPSPEGWRYDPDGLEGLDLPGGLVSLVTRRLALLGPGVAELLGAAAVLGRRFELRELAALDVAPPERLYAALGEAVAARLVQRLEGERHGFVHDRVRESLLARLPEPVRRSLHQRAAAMLEADPAARADRIYAIARHYALGVVAASPERYYAAHLEAGLAAMADFADEEAYVFLTRARAVALEFALEPDGALHEVLGAAAIRTGRLREALRHLEAALPFQRGPVQRAHVYSQLARVHLWNLDTPEAWRALEAGFGALGMRMDRPGFGGLLAAVISGVGTGLLRSLGLSRRLVDPRQAERLRALMHLYEQATEAAMFDGGSPAVLLLALLRSLQYGRALGRSAELAFALSSMGFLLAVAGLSRLPHRYFREAEAMAREMRDRHTAARVRHLEALSCTFRGEVHRAESLHRTYLAAHGAWLRTADYLNGLSDLVWSLFMRGHLREARELIAAALRRAQGAGSEAGAMRIHWWPHAYAGPVLTALGHLRDGDQHLQQIRPLLGENRSSWEIYCSMRLLTLLERGELGAEVDEVIDLFYRRDLHPRRPAPYHQRFYLFQGYARWAQWRAAAGEERARRTAELDQAVRELRRVGRHPILQAHAHLIRAAHAFVLGRGRVAERLLARAESLARTTDAPWVQFEALRLRAEMARSAGEAGPEERYGRLALALAIDQGWAGRVERLRAEGGRRWDLPTAAVPWGTGTADRLQRHWDALLRVSLAAAGSLDPDAAARALLRAILPIFGAERAFLFLSADGAADLRFVTGLDAGGAELTELTGHSRTVVERAAMSRQPVTVHDHRQAALLGAASIVDHDLRSIIAAPLLFQEQLVGVVYLDNRLTRGLFTREDEQTLLALATQIAVTLQSARLARLQVDVEAERQQRRLTERLRHATHALSASLSVQEVVERFRTLLPELLPASGVAVLRLEGGDLVPTAPVQPDGGARDPRVAAPLPLADHPVLRGVVETGQPRLIRDLAAAGVALPAGLGGTSGSWIGLPLAARGQVTGLACIWHDRAGELGLRDLEIAYTLAATLSIALANARLYEEAQAAATTDELTGIANRRQLMAGGRREWARARRERWPLAALMLDVDRFKQINDRHGHQAGDEVLRAVVRRCLGHLRAVDLMGRYGGEEFAILLPGADVAQALQVAERLRQAVCQEPVMTAAGPIPVTVSLGLALADERMEGLKALLSEADAALYRAKESGRNRVVVSPAATLGDAAPSFSGRIEGVKVEP